MIPRWSIAAVVSGSLLILAACAGGVAILGWPTVDWPQIAGTPYTLVGWAAGAAVVVAGVWLLLRTIRSARRRRTQKTPRAAAGGGDARGEAAVPARADGGAGAAALTITLILPLTPAGYPAGGHRAGRRHPLALAGPQSSRRRLTGGRQRRAVAAEAWNPEAATTEQLPAVRAETRAQDTAVIGALREEIQT